MSNFVVQLNELQKTHVKTTPAMSMKSVLEAACSNLKLDSSEYALKYRKEVLDLSLSVRFANIPTASRLELVKVGKRAECSKPISIALQVDDLRMTAAFPAETSLWSILLQFERQKQQENSSSMLNLTKRVGLSSEATSKKFSLKKLVKSIENIGKDTSTVYFLPVCVIMNREFSDIPTLQSTSLKSLGISSSTLIRVYFKETDVQLEDVLPLINVPLNNVTTDISEKVAQTISKPSSMNAGETMKVETAPVEEISDIAPKPAIVPSSTARSIHIENNNGEALTRNVQVYRLPKDSGALKIVLPESFFQLTSEELKFALKISQQRQKDQPLMTKSMRDKLEHEQEQKYPKTIIRIKFPDDSTVLQGTFLSQESGTFHTTVGAITENLSGTFPFVLYSNPPVMQKLDDLQDLTIYKTHLAPASVLYLKWESPLVGVTEHGFLSDDALKLIRDLPSHPSITQHADSATDEVEVEEDQMEHEDTKEKNKNDMMKMELDKKTEKRDEDSAKKVPRWLKLGKK